MSEFMKDIVTEVLQRNRKSGAPDLKPAAAFTAAVSAGTGACTGTCGGPGHPQLPQDRRCPEEAACPLPSIRRVNYQREQAVKRLAPLAGEPAATPAATPAAAPLPVHSAAAPAVQLPPPAATAGQSRPFAEDCLSPLLLRTLSHSGPAETHSPSGAEAMPPAAQGPVRLPLGSGMTAWWFPDITGELRRQLDAPGHQYRAAGVISCGRAEPGQLFAADELLADAPELNADLRWGEDGFELKLFGSDPGTVYGKLGEIAGRLGRETPEAGTVRVYASLHPSPLLRRHFGAGQQEAVAVVAAGSRWDCIGIVEQWRRQHPDTGLSISAGESYCLLSGAAEQVAAAAAELGGIAGQMQV